MNGAYFRYNHADAASSLDSAGQINVIEQERVLFVEKGTEVPNQIASEEAEGRTRLLDLFDISEVAIAVEVVVLDAAAEDEAIQRPAEPMVVGENVKDGWQASNKLLRPAVPIDKERCYHTDLGMNRGVANQIGDGVVHKKDVVVGHQQVAPPAALIALVAGPREEEILVIKDGCHPGISRRKGLDGVSA